MSTWSPAKKIVHAAGAVVGAVGVAFVVSQTRTHAESGRVGREIRRLAGLYNIEGNARLGPPYVEKGGTVEVPWVTRVRDIGEDGSPTFDEGDLARRRVALLALQRGDWKVERDPRFGGLYLRYDREQLERDLAAAAASAVRVRVAPDVARSSGDYLPDAARPAAAVRANPGGLRGWLSAGGRRA